MVRKRRIVIPLGFVTLATLIGCFAGELLPEPTDPLTVYILEWVATFKPSLDATIGKFAEIWSYYVFSAIWYLFLVAIVLQLGDRKKKIQTFVKVLMIVGGGYVVLFWIGDAPLFPMNFETGIQMLIGSIIVFAVLSAFVIWKFAHTETEVQFK